MKKFLQGPPNVLSLAAGIAAGIVAADIIEFAAKIIVYLVLR